jgi:polyhydroxyalkanoate synthase
MPVAAPQLSSAVSPDAFGRTGLETAARNFDRVFRSTLARVTMGLSPEAVAEAYFDWLFHLAAVPGKQALVAFDAWRNAIHEAPGRYVMES